MLNFLRQLDIVSRLVIVITFVLFVVALFIKGFGHGLLLEAGVFLVSVKLIMMAAKNVLLAKHLDDRLDRIETTLTRTVGLHESQRPSDPRWQERLLPDNCLLLAGFGAFWQLQERGSPSCEGEPSD